MKNAIKLKKWREKKGLSRPEVAMKLSEAVKRPVPTTSVQSWEEGRAPRVELAFALQDLTGIPARDWVRVRTKSFSK